MSRKPAIISRDGVRFQLHLPPGAAFALTESGIVVCAPGAPPLLYRYRDDGPLLAEEISPIAGKTHGVFHFA